MSKKKPTKKQEHKKECDCSEKEDKYTGETYLNVQMHYDCCQTEKVMEEIKKLTMGLDKCRMLVYTNIQVGKPHCGSQGCS